MRHFLYTLLTSVSLWAATEPGQILSVSSGQTNALPTGVYISPSPTASGEGTNIVVSGTGYFNSITSTNEITAATPSADDSDTSAATTAYVQGELTAYASDTATLSNKTLDAGSNSFTSWPEVLIVAASDESTAITTGTNKLTFRFPYALTLTGIRASVGIAPTGSTIIIDVNESGTTILSTKLTIDASEKTSTSAATAVVISDTAIADDAEITIDFDQVGSSTAGAGVKITFYGTRTI